VFSWSHVILSVRVAYELYDDRSGVAAAHVRVCGGVRCVRCVRETVVPLTRGVIATYGWGLGQPPRGAKYRTAMTTPPTKEPQYSLLFDVKEKHGIARLGLMVNESWSQDPKRTLFTLARYKFVSRMLAGDRHVLEVGCADAFGTRIVQQAVKR